MKKFVNTGVPSRLPFLVYHDICHSPRSPYDTDVGKFIHHLDLIETKGWSAISLRAFLEWQMGGMELPSRPLVMTFDDGYSSHADVVFPLLLKRGLAGTFFISIGFVEKKGYLSWDQIAEMDRGGMEIGSHGISHYPLSYMSDTDLERELGFSRDTLEEKLGHSVDFLSIPRGYYSRRVREFAIRAGYRAVCTSRIAYNRRFSDPHDLGRIWIMGRKDIEAVLEGRGSRVTFQRFKQAGREIARASMGYSIYNKLRRVLLGEQAEKPGIK